MSRRQCQSMPVAWVQKRLRCEVCGLWGCSAPGWAAGLCPCAPREGEGRGRGAAEPHSQARRRRLAHGDQLVSAALGRTWQNGIRGAAVSALQAALSGGRVDKRGHPGCFQTALFNGWDLWVQNVSQGLR